MKRRIFFWLERLKITPAERKTMGGLMVMLAILGSVNWLLSASVPFEGDDYLELEKQFQKRTAMLEAREQQLKKQYFPSSKSNRMVVHQDTVPADTTGSPTEENDAHELQSSQININTAGIDSLDTLPGIGPTYARRILEYRKKNGGFETLEELKKIKGIAQKRLDKLKPFVKLKDSK